DFISGGGRKIPLYREQDLSWKDFLSSGHQSSRSDHYSPVYQSIDSVTNILFSSGTTGWVIGPTLLYNCFLNGATLALYHGFPQGRGFGKFVQASLPSASNDAGVTILGTVPSLVKSWKSTRCMEGLDWTKIK
ncbi:putative acyl-activating enzyme 17 peroxisomal protein, partial [Trifolium medium]|nr:putative acyl-activating enzyme 17 peroxisomal protein [Trifolium medium]